MLYKIFYYIINKYKKRANLLKKDNGLTLVEVIIAIAVISIITFILLQSTRVAVNTLRLNEIKTKAIAVANEKIETLRAMNYDDIEITAENPDWVLDYPELSKDGYVINYDITWVSGVDSYKQVEVTVSTDPMNTPIEVVTQIYPTSVVESIIDYPPPANLYIEYDNGSGSNREIKLSWTAPDTELVIDRYNIYRNSVYLASSSIETYIDHPGSNKKYTYYVTAVYEDGTESVKSNEVTTN
jgi:prepilin-type N-terminal cleavage/methylation domain-containing protein